LNEPFKVGALQGFVHQKLTPDRVKRLTLCFQVLPRPLPLSIDDGLHLGVDAARHLLTEVLHRSIESPAEERRASPGAIRAGAQRVAHPVVADHLSRELRRASEIVLSTGGNVFACDFLSGPPSQEDADPIADLVARHEISLLRWQLQRRS
jgi:hypothetical protein